MFDLQFVCLEYDNTYKIGIMDGWKFKERLSFDKFPEKKYGKFRKLEGEVEKFHRKRLKPTYEEVLKRLKCKEVWISDSIPYEGPDGELGDDKTWEAWFWRHRNPLCLACQKKCKQSWQVEVVSCPDHKKIKEK